MSFFEYETQRRNRRLDDNQGNQYLAPWCSITYPMADGLHPGLGMFQQPRFTAAPHITWILVAHRSGARLFASPSGAGPVGLIREIPFPEGRMQNREIDSDTQGSHYSTVAGKVQTQGGHSGGAPAHQMKHGFSPHVDPAEHFADKFAMELTRILRDGRTRNEFDSLILVAEPGFLGKLRCNLDKDTCNRLVATENHNWSDLHEKEVMKRIHDLISKNRKVA